MRNPTALPSSSATTSTCSPRAAGKTAHEESSGKFPSRAILIRTTSSRRASAWINAPRPWTCTPFCKGVLPEKVSSRNKADPTFAVSPSLPELARNGSELSKTRYASPNCRKHLPLVFSVFRCIGAVDKQFSGRLRDVLSLMPGQMLRKFETDGELDLSYRSRATISQFFAE